MRWPLEDEIRWIEWRLLELEHGESCNAPLTAVDCRIWLSYKRDGMSYAAIASAEYARYWHTAEGKRGNQKTISLVRRTVNRVEQYLIDPNRKLRRSEKEELSLLLEVVSLGGLSDLSAFN